jgi:hypothetical protein
MNQEWSELRREQNRPENGRKCMERFVRYHLVPITSNQYSLSEISGSHTDEYEYDCILGYCAVQSRINWFKSSTWIHRKQRTIFVLLSEDWPVSCLTLNTNTSPSEGITLSWNTLTLHTYVGSVTKYVQNAAKPEDSLDVNNRLSNDFSYTQAPLINIAIHSTQYSSER